MGYTVPTDMTSRHVAVIGSGTLGRHVGLVWATKGGSVIIVDSKSEAASAAFAWIKKELPSQVKAVHGTSGQVVKETDIEKTVKGASMVVECIPEIKEAKIELLSQLDRFCDEDTIIATISSSYNSGDLLGYSVDYIRRHGVDKENPGTVTGKGLYDHEQTFQTPSSGQKASLRSQLIGAWELVDYSAHKESHSHDKVYPIGERAQGIIMYTPDGYMSAQLQNPGTPKFQVNDLNGGTKEEFQAAGENYLPYTGPYSTILMKVAKSRSCNII